MSEPVVVGLTRSRASLRALEWAAAAAALRGRPLRLVHVLPAWQPDVPVFPPGRYEVHERRGRELLGYASSIAAACFPKLEMSYALPSGPVAALLRAESERADLLVVGAGSAGRRLAGHALAPVAVVRDGLNAARGEVLVGLDGSPHTDPALEFAFEEASLRRCRLRAMHAWEGPPPEGDVLARQREMLGEWTGPWREKYPEVDLVLSPSHAHPATALRHASAWADLLVVGARGIGLAGVALGSVSQAMLRRSLCPVTVVRARS